MTTITQNLVDRLNAYAGDDPWEDVILAHPAYDEAATDRVEHGEGNMVGTTDGRVIKHLTGPGGWGIVGFVDEYADDDTEDDA